jgi:hypothetical protein
MASLSINVAVKFQVAAKFLFTLQRRSLAFERPHSLKMIGSLVRVSWALMKKRRLIPPSADYTTAD